MRLRFSIYIPFTKHYPITVPYLICHKNFQVKSLCLVHGPGMKFARSWAYFTVTRPAPPGRAGPGRADPWQAGTWQPGAGRVRSAP